jgi:hypothetical protein
MIIKVFHTQLVQDLSGVLDYFQRNNRALPRPDFGHKMTAIRCPNDRASQ